MVHEGSRDAHRDDRCLVTGDPSDQLGVVGQCDPGPAHLDPGPVGAGLSTPTTAPGGGAQTRAAPSSQAALALPRQSVGRPAGGASSGPHAAGLPPVDEGHERSQPAQSPGVAGALAGAGGGLDDVRCPTTPRKTRRALSRADHRGAPPGADGAVAPGGLRPRPLAPAGRSAPAGARRAGDGLDGLAPRRAPGDAGRPRLWQCLAVGLVAAARRGLCAPAAPRGLADRARWHPLVPGPRALAPGGSALASPGAVRRGSTLPAPARQRGVLLARRARPRPHSAAPAPTGARSTLVSGHQPGPRSGPCAGAPSPGRAGDAKSRRMARSACSPLPWSSSHASSASQRQRCHDQGRQSRYGSEARPPSFRRKPESRLIRSPRSSR